MSHDNEANHPSAADLEGLAAVVPAAGIGSRMGADRPKQYLTLQGRFLLDITLARLRGLLPRVPIHVGLHAEDRWWEDSESARLDGVFPFQGGPSRADTVRLGLDILSVGNETEQVLVHDVARPCITAGDIMKLLRSGCSPHGGLLVAAIADTVKEVDMHSRVTGTRDRNQLRRALTPQLFPLITLREALRSALSQGVEVTDESSAMELLGFAPVAVEGRADNIKITRPEDLDLAAWYLQRQENEQGNHPLC